MAPLARLQRVTYTYPTAPRPCLLDVSLELEPAEVVLLLGGSGSGKSTLLRALNGLVPHFHGGTFAGRVTVAGRDTRDSRPRDLASIVGLVFQDPENQAVMTTVEREIAFGLENLGIPTDAVSRLVEEALVSLGLSRLRRVDLATLSGGELQKVALAAVIAMQPQLLLLDEPTSQLDPVSSEDLLAAVRRLAEDTGATVVLAEHRVERCLHLATRVLLMDEGRVVSDGGPQEFAGWAASERQELLPPVTRLFARRQRGGGEPRDLPLTVKDARRLLERDPDLRPQRVPTALPAAPNYSSPHPVLEVRGLTAGYPPDDPVLEDVSLALRAGEVVAIMGENGAGKSTLVRHFNGLARPLAGTLLLEGRDLATLTVAEAARSCAFLGQNPNACFVRSTVAAEIAHTLEHLGIPPEEHPLRVAAAVDELDLGGLLDREPRDLSGGERTRAALAAMSCGDPALVVLDEPTRGLDPSHKLKLRDVVRAWAAHGRCVAIVTHDVEFAARAADRVLVLGDGGVLADGPVERVLHGSLFFSTQIDRLLRHTLPGPLHEEHIEWTSDRQ